MFRNVVFIKYLQLSIPISIQNVSKFGETETKLLAVGKNNLEVIIDLLLILYSNRVTIRRDKFVTYIQRHFINQFPELMNITVIELAKLRMVTGNYHILYYSNRILCI